MIKGVIDQIECDIAKIEMEDGHTIEYPKHLLPSEAEVGDVIQIIGNVLTVDKQATAARRSEVDKLMDELFED
ncbi:DUF3006 domain-containing protein [Paenibacillus apiarius]|uniref:DUF3006 domain-containing protein n=1 Tax=Paenibacillus apiarius TaxID=46240 RepID=A0ABT4DQR0_9BACL|nr:DUF3006 domain-containing protein [Paenibacillus apiarius]MCY9513329.1 DUF3006 domain-containing protein [Paenibacillus apiarius]MCY9519699.1 DUF3006 domain-containing protein [Paenibacillus apiarius]MCY9553245.1 DUF3006 domain-containing protein [Paenibacillus apiarius]MCY9557095.1 DUF3006 domain-containing protein [Paenibacillus apiarius]MCY9682164.1 DUF3006 domain-containing protein [Paenibacillus apiarius]